MCIVRWFKRNDWVVAAGLPILFALIGSATLVYAMNQTYFARMMIEY